LDSIDDKLLETGDETIQPVDAEQRDCTDNSKTVQQNPHS
jgi:hypothetical protein